MLRAREAGTRSLPEKVCDMAHGVGTGAGDVGGRDLLKIFVQLECKIVDTAQDR